MPLLKGVAFPRELYFNQIRVEITTAIGAHMPSESH